MQKIIYKAVSAAVLLAILICRIYLLATDTSRSYAISSLEFTKYTYIEVMPEIAVILALAGLFLSKTPGLVVNILSLATGFYALFYEGIFSFADLVDYGGTLSTATKPSLNIPVMIIAAISLVLISRKQPPKVYF